MASLTIKKQVKNCIWYNEGAIKVENVRASYPHLAKKYAGKPKEGETQEQAQARAKYGIVGMLPKSTHVEAKTLIIEAKNAILLPFRDKEGNLPKIASSKMFIRNGDEEENDSYAGHWIVSARETRRPSVRNARGELITDLDEIAEKIYGGCWVNMLFRPWYQDGVRTGAGYGKRMNAGLVGVQFVKDDTPFGEGSIDDTEAWGDETAKNGGKSAGDGMDDDDDL